MGSAARAGPPAHRPARAVVSACAHAVVSACARAV